MQKEFTLYILINKDLGMGKGKIVSQGCHAVHHIVHQILTNSIEKPNDAKIQKYYQEYMKWSNRCSKIISLNVPFVEIQKIIEETKDTYPHVVIHDAGRTQVEPGSMTCCAFYPSDELTDRMKSFKLL